MLKHIIKTPNIFFLTSEKVREHFCNLQSWNSEKLREHFCNLQFWIPKKWVSIFVTCDFCNHEAHFSSKKEAQFSSLFASTLNYSLKLFKWDASQGHFIYSVVGAWGQGSTEGKLSWWKLMYFFCHHMSSMEGHRKRTNADKECAKLIKSASASAHPYCY